MQGLLFPMKTSEQTEGYFSSPNFPSSMLALDTVMFTPVQTQHDGLTFQTEE